MLGLIQVWHLSGLKLFPKNLDLIDEYRDLFDPFENEMVGDFQAPGSWYQTERIIVDGSTTELFRIHHADTF